MMDYQDARSRAFASGLMNFQARVALLGNLLGSAVRARKKQIRSNVDSSRRYLELIDFDLVELGRQEGHVARALVLGVDFWLATKESVDDWLSGLEIKAQGTSLTSDDLLTDSECAEDVTYPPSPPPPRLPAAGLNLTRQQCLLRHQASHQLSRDRIDRERWACLGFLFLPSFRF